jgi:hypothetical protein
MITHHLQAVRERDEPVSALYAAEAGIYGRFGYGLATRPLRFVLPRSAGLRDVPGWRDVRLRLAADPTGAIGVRLPRGCPRGPSA